MKKSLDRYTCSRCGTTEELPHEQSRPAPNDWMTLEQRTGRDTRVTLSLLCWDCRLSFGDFIRGSAVDKAAS